MTSFFGLGWIKINTYIMIKKALFVMTILRLETPNVIKDVFLLRLEHYLKDQRKSMRNMFNSPLFDIFNSCLRLGLLEQIIKMVKGISPILSKKMWSKLVWEKAWSLDDAYWKSLIATTDDSNILYKTIGVPRYLSWWQISDNCPRHTKMCESLARLVCKTSLLKSDDYRLKGLAPSNRVCNQCDLYASENVKHILMQCPTMEDDRVKLYQRLSSIDRTIEERMKNEPQNVFFWMLGGSIEGMEIELMTRFWITSGYAINKMYRKVTKGRDGIG